jgi:uncharacterized protein
MIAMILLLISFIATIYAALPNQRPDYDKRTFHSSAIDQLILTLQPLFKNPELATVFANSLPNTLDTTVSSYTKNPENINQTDLDAFIITGDIDALWLRDSMNQVLPYLPYSVEDKTLQYLFEGLINRHAKSILIDSFANAFNFNASGAGHQSDQRTPPMTRSVFEGKYEIDSLAAFLKLSYWYSRFNEDNGALERFADDRWLSAVEKVLDTVHTMQLDTGRSSNPPYLFRRLTTEAMDTLVVQGRGPPANPNGLTRSLFRPSDDAVVLPYNIPGNAMICVEMNHLQSMLSKLSVRKVRTNLKISPFDLLSYTKSISDPLCSSLESLITSTAGNIIPYEVDGFGSSYFMDDANIPSLLSLPVLGYMKNSHAAYISTRANILSAQNPYFYSGSVASGIGGPHAGFNYTWPMAIAMKALTSNDKVEIQEALDLLLSTTAGTGLMHESFNVNNANDYTRSWFAWANGVFGELVLQTLHTAPELVIDVSNSSSLDVVKSIVKPPVSFLAQQESLLA